MASRAVELLSSASSSEKGAAHRGRGSSGWRLRPRASSPSGCCCCSSEVEGVARRGGGRWNLRLLLRAAQEEEWPGRRTEDAAAQTDGRSDARGTARNKLDRVAYNVGPGLFYPNMGKWIECKVQLTIPIMDAPLLGNMDAPLLGNGAGKTVGLRESLVATEVRKQLYLAGPLVAAWLLQNLVQMISVMFVGHLGELALSSASVATSFAGVTGFSWLSGMASSLDTLCGQAFGAKQFHLLGIYKQRAIFVLTLVSVVVAVVWSYTGQILLFFGQDPEISAGAGSYIRWMIPALFVYGPLQCQVRFLQTQNNVLQVMLSAAVTALNHVLVCWLLVYRLGLGNKGAAVANSISYLTNTAILALYIRLAPACKHTWRGLSKEAFHEIPKFLRLGVPSALMVCLEWWSFELLVLLSGLLPNPKLETSVLSICLNTGSLAFMIPFGLGAAISTRVSNELGAGRPQAARLATRVVLMLALAVGAVVGLGMVLVRNLWGYAYSNEKDVVEYIARMMPILAVSFVFDSLQGVLSGVARGCGWQKIGACVNLGAYYLIGVPAGYCIAFIYHLGGMGLWLGIMCALVVQMVLLLTITLCSNWEKEASNAKDRVFSTSLPVDMTT